ncbi:hypothetical protein HU200_027824 [Digitaria exilis]|uniref:Uncharacterized protein n=1 Tax=Digitaria exilis TaxID=1010633 RepID=A0A835ETB4_9POAL|nr:hypothetical protein HU200_027824 [Digitaria exilis]
MKTIMSLGFFLFLLALASTASPAMGAPWSGGDRRRSAVLIMAPAGGSDALSPTVQPTGDDGVLAPPPAAPDTLSPSHGAPPPTDGVATPTKPRRLVPLPPSGPSIRGHV